MKLPLYKLKDNSNDHTKTTSMENSPLHQGPRFQGLSHRERGGRKTLETSWLERARFYFIEKQSKFYCKGF